MKKQKKQMALALALLLIFGAAYAGMRAYNANQEKKEQEEEENAKVYITRVKQEEITAFSYQVQNETLEFVKEGDEWTSRKDEGISLNQEAVKAVLSSLTPLEAEDCLKDVLEKEAESEYGFASPQNVITFTTAEGTTTLIVGMDNAVTGQCYLRKQGEDGVYLVAGSFPSSFAQTLEDLEEESEETETQEPTEEANVN